MQLQHKSLSLDHVCWAAAIGAYVALRSRWRVGVSPGSEMNPTKPVRKPTHLPPGLRLLRHTRRMSYACLRFL